MKIDIKKRDIDMRIRAKEKVPPYRQPKKKKENEELFVSRKDEKRKTNMYGNWTQEQQTICHPTKICSKSCMTIQGS